MFRERAAAAGVICGRVRQAVQRLTKGQVVAVEGKTLRGSHDRTFGKAAIERVGAVEADAYRLSVYADRESVLVAYVALRALAV